QLHEWLTFAKRNNYEFIITGDESWILYSYPNAGKWAPKGTLRDEHEKTTVATPKTMLTVMFSGKRFWLVDFLPHGITMNSHVFIDRILGPTMDAIDDEYPDIDTEVILHIDNSPVHNSKISKNYVKDTILHRVDHPAYSPDLAPSDFWLFGDLKRSMKGQRFQEQEQLENFVKGWLAGQSEAKLKSVFDEWRDRCYAVACGDGIPCSPQGELSEGSWYETNQIVPDLVTPANDATPLSDDTVTAGISTEYSRSDHVHPLNIQQQPFHLSILLVDHGTVGTSNCYARNDNSHPINVETNASNIPIVNGVGANGTSAFYARQDHVHPQQLTYDGNVTATKFIKTGRTNNDILLANGDTTTIDDRLSRTYSGCRLIRLCILLDLVLVIHSLNLNGIYLGCNPNLTYGALTDQWSIINTPTGELGIRVGDQLLNYNQRLMISADGYTLTFNGSVIAETGTTNGATTNSVSGNEVANGSVNYSAGNLILWVQNSTDPISGFNNDGAKVYLRAHPLTMGLFPP
ncbi:MAG: hypothetical protein EZS28_006119, partial [Streblomastix strix]